ncbi:MAG: efflux RND transporter permease subunit, partial [Fuerstiella sp.]|nr:efflux RND transporter permease subunit [Fuerstiella sp.]
LFRDIAIAISCAVALSLLVSITVIPTAAARLLSRRRGDDEGHAANLSVSNDPPSLPSQTDIEQGFGIHGLFGLMRLGSWLNHGFADGMKRLLSMRGSSVIRLAIVFAFVAGSLGLSQKLLPDTEYLPGGNRNLIIALLLPPPGYNVDQMISLGANIEKQLARSGRRQSPANPEFLFCCKRTQPVHGSSFNRRIAVGRADSDPVKGGRFTTWRYSDCQPGQPVRQRFKRGAHNRH